MGSVSAQNGICGEGLLPNESGDNALFCVIFGNGQRKLVLSKFILIGQLWKYKLRKLDAKSSSLISIKMLELLN